MGREVDLMTGFVVWEKGGAMLHAGRQGVRVLDCGISSIFIFDYKYNDDEPDSIEI